MFRQKYLNIFSLLGMSCGPNTTPWAPQNEAEAVCHSNSDGFIDASEFSVRTGSGATYGVSENPGLSDSWYERWIVPEDIVMEAYSLEAQDIGAQWFAGFFPHAQWTIPTDKTSSLLGVYFKDANGFWLLGSASAQENPPQGKTLLIYDRPVPILRFPLEKGVQWEIQASIEDGVLQGLPFWGSHHYSISVIEVADLFWDDLTFQNTLRVHSDLTVAPDIGSGFSIRQNSFFAPCMGEVLRLVSTLDEPEEDFTRVQTLQIILTP